MCIECDLSNYRHLNICLEPTKSAKIRIASKINLPNNQTWTNILPLNKETPTVDLIILLFWGWMEVVCPRVKTFDLASSSVWELTWLFDNCWLGWPSDHRHSVSDVHWRYQGSALCSLSHFAALLVPPPYWSLARILDSDWSIMSHLVCLWSRRSLPCNYLTTQTIQTKLS